MSYDSQQLQRTHSGLFVQSSPGYMRLVTLWNSYVTDKVTECLQAALARYKHPAKVALRDLDSEQVLFLSLLHCLLQKDVAACFVLADIIAKVEPLKSSNLVEWLIEAFDFSSHEIRMMLKSAAELSKLNINFSDYFLNAIENLHKTYCSPKKEDWYTCGLPMPPPAGELIIDTVPECTADKDVPKNINPVISRSFSEFPTLTPSPLPQIFESPWQIGGSASKKRTPVFSKQLIIGTIPDCTADNDKPENINCGCLRRWSTNDLTEGNVNEPVFLRSFSEFPTITPSPLPQIIDPWQLNGSRTQKGTAVFPKQNIYKDNDKSQEQD